MPSSVRFSRSAYDAGRIVPIQGSRFWGICLFFLLWFVIIGLRLFQLQIVQSKVYKEKAEQQQQRDVAVPPQRGDLLDRNHALLATTVQVDSVYAQPALIADKPTTANELAELLRDGGDQDSSISAEQIAARLSSGKASIRIARAITPKVAASITAYVAQKNAELNAVKQPEKKRFGISLEKEFRRYYPNNQIAAQVLGYVNIDDVGQGGLEQKFESVLHGQAGRVNRAVDAHSKTIESTQDDPRPGRNLVLTIDESIQFRAERALDAAMARTQALNGTVVVQDVHTGQILALAVRPTYNPNALRPEDRDYLRNSAVSNVYEPGSTFKLVTYAAALEQHVVTPDDRIDCQGGSIVVAGKTIHDDEGDHFGVITVHEALEHSSDVAVIKLAQKVGPERLSQYMRDFGFGQRSGIELPAETRGLLPPYNRWGATTYAYAAIGQGIAVTPLQLVSLVSAIANGGVYLPPRVLMPGQLNTPAKPSDSVAAPVKITADLPNPLPEGAHRVISTMAAAQMRKMMEGVVLYGTGKKAQLNGYSSGGKTGTAQKADPVTHKYNPAWHIASFAGLAPVNNPVIAVAVIIDTPKGAYYGAEVAAPVFSEVAQQVLESMGVPHDVPARITKSNAKAKPAQRPIHEDENGSQADLNALYATVNDLPSDDPIRSQTLPPTVAAPVAASAVFRPAVPVPAPQLPPTPAAQQQVQITLNSSKRFQVPALIGLSMRKAIEQAAQAGLEVEITGSGTVRQQAPAAGTLVPSGTHIVARCGR